MVRAYGMRTAKGWILCVALTLAVGIARGQTPPPCLWQIGEADSKTNDLALGPTGYGKFSADPTFIVGRSKARDSWPYVQPGPADGWAGGRPHVFTVLFNVDELPRPLAGQAEVRLLLYDTHSQSPPLVEVALNGKPKTLPTTEGAGDASIMKGGPGQASRLSFEFPADTLQRGMNTVEIRTAEGSWMLYDAVRFFAPAGVRLGVAAPTFYRIESVQDSVLKRRTAQPTQVVRVNVFASADQPVSASLAGTVESFGARQTTTQLVTVRAGRQTLELDVPRLSSWPAKVSVSLSVGGRQFSTGTAAILPHRDWTVYLVPHSHVDIGYTEVQTKILELQKKSLTEAMDFVEEHPEFTGDARFCWSVEVLWAIKDYLRHADAVQRERLLRHVRNGTVGLDGLFANELTGLCTSEEMVRLIGYAGRLVRDYGLQIDSAMITDVPGYSWGLCAVMAGAGIKYFDMGPNGGDRIGSIRQVWRDKPFYWVAPDGRHRVLTWLSPFDYYRVFGLLENPEGVNRLLGYLQSLESNPYYPYDIVRSRMCTGDNGTPPFGLCRTVRDWNARYESPHLIIGRSRDAFVALEKKFANRIPSYRGDFSPFWEDGAASSADETHRNRHSAIALETAEKVWSAATVASGQTGTKVPTDALDGAWDNVILYDEHTWGAHNSISAPDAPFVAAQWKIKQAFALDGEKQSAELVRDGLAALALNVSTGPDRAVLVFNPCSWSRTDLVSVELPPSDNTALVDSTGRTAAVARSEDRRRLTFIARDVPPLGYRTYRLVAADRAGKPAVEPAVIDPEKGLLKSRFFSVQLDKQSASARVVEVARRGLRGQRLVSSGDFNRFLYCKNGDTSQVTAAANAEIQPARPNSPDGAALALRSQAPGCRSLVQIIELHGELPWMDITNTLDRGDVRQPEGLYFDFPLQGLRHAGMAFDTAWARVRLEKDLIPAACKNCFCVQDWVEASDKRQTVVLAPIDAPLVEIGEIHPNGRTSRLPIVEQLRLDPPRALSFVMNNYWHTNYRASQPGTTSFSYRVYWYDGPSNPVETMRRGIEAREPLRATALAANNNGALPAGASSFARVSPDHVLVTAVTPAERGGTLIRVREIAGRHARVELTAGGFGKQAERVDLWERKLAPLELKTGQLRFEMGPYEIATIRVFQSS